VAVSATRGSRPAALPIGGCHMTRMIKFSAPILTLGVLFSLPAQAEDTMMKKDEMHMSKPAHHTKKGAMMHKDNMMHKDSMMKKDTMMKDDTQK
jgi:hypothetical protein